MTIEPDDDNKSTQETEKFVAVIDTASENDETAKLGDESMCAEYQLLKPKTLELKEEIMILKTSI